MEKIDVKFWEEQLLKLGLIPSAGHMIWTRPGQENNYEIYLTDYDGCTIFFQKGEKNWERTVENATITQVMSVMSIYHFSKKL